MKNQFSQKRIILTGILFLIFVTFLIVSWKLSAENGVQSHAFSTQIAEKIENGLDKYFYINHRDSFWTGTFDSILRKVAHFTEYAVIGTIMCLMLNVAIGKAWVAALISILISPIFGLLDEYHQMFSPERTPLLLDVYIDTAGIITGVIIVTVFFWVYSYIRKLKYRIKELESDDLAK